MSVPDKTTENININIKGLPYKPEIIHYGLTNVEKEEISNTDQIYFRIKLDNNNPLTNKFLETLKNLEKTIIDILPHEHIYKNQNIDNKYTPYFYKNSDEEKSIDTINNSNCNIQEDNNEKDKNINCIQDNNDGYENIYSEKIYII